MGAYKKAILAVFGAAVVAVHQLSDGTPWTIARGLLVVLAVLGAFTVYVAPNLPAGNGVGTYAKAFVAWATAGIEATLPLLDDSVITGSEWLLVVMAVLTAAGVPLVKNTATIRSLN